MFGSRLCAELSLPAKPYLGKKKQKQTNKHILNTHTHVV